MDLKSNLYGFGSSTYPPLFENEPPPLNDKSPMSKDWFDLSENVVKDNDNEEEFDNGATKNKFLNSSDEENCFHDNSISGKQNSIFHCNGVLESIFNFREQNIAQIDGKIEADDFNFVRKEENSVKNFDITKPLNSLLALQPHEFSANNAYVEKIAFRESYFDQTTSSHFFNDIVNTNKSSDCNSIDENNKNNSMVTKTPLFELKESNELDFIMTETVHIDPKISELSVIKENDKGCCSNFPLFSYTDVTEYDANLDFPEQLHLPFSSNTDTGAMCGRFSHEHKVDGKVSEYEEYSSKLNFDHNQSDVDKANIFHVDHQYEKTSKNESSEFKNESVWIPNFTGFYDSDYVKSNEESVELFSQSNTEVNRVNNIHSKDTDSNFLNFSESSKFLFNNSQIKADAINEGLEIETTCTTLNRNLQSTDNLGFTPSECYGTNIQEAECDKSYIACVDNERFDGNFITSWNPNLSDFNESFNKFCSFSSNFKSTAEEQKDNSLMDESENSNLYSKFEESIPSKAFNQKLQESENIETSNSAMVQLQFSEFSDFGNSPIAFYTEKTLDFNPFSNSVNKSVQYAPTSNTHDSNISTKKQVILQRFHLSDTNFGDKYEIFNLRKLDEKVCYIFLTLYLIYFIIIYIL